MILDGAHNEPALQKLKKHVSQIWNDEYDLIFSCLADRNFLELLQKILPEKGEVSVVSFDAGLRSPQKADLEMAERSFLAKQHVLDSVLMEKIKRSLQRPVLVCGSLLFCAKFTQWWKSQKELL